MAHDNPSSAGSNDDARSASDEQPNARSGPSLPGNAADARISATNPSDARSGLTHQEQSDRWPLG